MQCSVVVPKWNWAPTMQDALQTHNKIMAPDASTSRGNCRNGDCKWICQTDGSDQSMGWQLNPSCYGILRQSLSRSVQTGSSPAAHTGRTNHSSPWLHLTGGCCISAMHLPGHHPAWNRDGWTQKRAPGRLAPVKCYKNRGQWVQMHFILPVCPTCGWITHWGASLLVVCDISHLDPAPSSFPHFPHAFSSKIQSSPGNKQRKHWPFSQRNIQPREEMSSSHRPIEDQDSLLRKSRWVRFLEKRLFSSWFWVPALWLFGYLCHTFPQEVVMFLIPVFWHVHVPTQWHILIQMSLHCISVNRI